MKSWLIRVLAGLLGLASLTVTAQQQQPVLAVKITDVAVLAGGSAVAFIDITNVGVGYRTAPEVHFSDPEGAGGVRAAATATLSLSGSVASIVITEPGSGYARAPLVWIDPPPPPPAGGTSVNAEAKAYIGIHFNQPNQNESYGPAYGTPIAITALAEGTFPAAGFTYEFFVDGISIGVAVAHPPAGTPASVGWTPPHPGAYFLTVKANDGARTVASLPVRYFATGTEIVSPTPNTLVPIGSSVVLQATATPQPKLESGTSAFVQRIEFWADDVKIGEDTTAPYSFIYKPADAPTNHKIQAKAFDNEGHEILPLPSAIETISMVTPIGGLAQLPTCTISSPAHDATLGIPATGTDLSVAVAAASPNGFISKVELYVDGILADTASTFPYAFKWHPTVVGDYRLVALAYDDKNNVVASTSDPSNSLQPVPTKIKIAALPTVTLVSPDAGSSVGAGTAVTLTAAATDSNVGGSVTKVQFLIDGKFVGEDATPEGNRYSIAWIPSTAGTVTIRAVAINSVGLSSSSSDLTVNVTQGGGGGGSPIGNPPTVTVTSPAAGTGLPVSQAALITASAADSDGNISSVEFFVNGQTLSTTTAYPYSATWTPNALGTYLLTAKALDNHGNSTTSAEVSVSVIDPSPSAPSVTVTNPANGSTLIAGNPTTLQASASDDVSIASVQFFVNGQSFGSAITMPPYNLAWTPSSAGSFTIVARAKDNVGNQTTSAPVVVTVGGGAKPNVAITSPAANVTVGAGTIVNLAATASDSDGTVSSVKFLANGVAVATAVSAPYLGTWSPSAAGVYTLTAQATDNAGNISTSSPITVTVSGNGAPVVSITSPSLGAGVPVGTTTIVSASASDSDGLIANVSFYANGVLLGTDNTPPYTANWAPSAAGTYRLTAMAVDNSGSSTMSATVIVIAGTAGADNVDTIASGIFIAPDYAGNFAAIRLGSGSMTFIGYIPVTATDTPAKTFYFTDVAVDSSGTFQQTVDGAPTISGQFSDAGVNGTFYDGAAAVVFSGPNTFAQSAAAVRAGYYNGSIGDKPGNLLTALVGLDAKITVYFADGSVRDSGAGSVSTNGGFTVNTRAGNKLSGTIDPTTGLVTGTLQRSGQTVAAITGAASSGGGFSDGSLRNVSTRAQVGTGDNILIAGFVVSGSAPKRVLIRAIGPGLIPHGIMANDVLANPTLTLHRIGGTATQVGFSDEWNAGDGALVAAANQVGAFGIPAGSHDAAILARLSQGVYTATVAGVGGGTGIALLEMYDVDPVPAFSGEKMVNISTRGQVGAGDQIVIAGFIVNGTAPKKVLIRGVGPGLSPLGVNGALSDPMLRLDRRVGTSFVRVRENDNWEAGNDAALIRSATSKVGATPPLTAGSKDAALLLLLPPGIYSAQLSGVGGATGVGLIEVYEVQ